MSDNACSAEWELMQQFRKFVETIPFDQRQHFFHPLNRSRWITAFTAWLEVETSFASAVKP